MIKKISTLALAAMVALPSLAFAAGSGDLAEQIERLTRELEALKQQVSEVQNTTADLEDSSEKWDFSSRFQWSGDIRTRMDIHDADTATYYKATDVADGVMTYVNAQPALAGIGGQFANIGAMLQGLQPIMGSPEAWRAGMTGMGAITDVAQQDALYAMFTNPEVGGMLMNMAAYPVSALTDQMASPALLAAFMRDNLSAGARKAIFDQIHPATAAANYENDTSYTTRMRLNARVKATEDIEIKARVVGYKVWGMQESMTPEINENGINDTDSPYFLNSRSFDGTSGRQPVDNKLVLDRAFMNWNNIAGQPIWFSIGRRPTTDGPPAQLRLGADTKMATPVNYMDYPFDGLSLGYAYSDLFGMEDFTGRIRFCYGRGFEAGPSAEGTGVNDVDFAGLSWDIYQKGDRFVNIQAFGAFNIFNVPGDTYFPNPLELGAINQGLAAGTAYQNVTTGNYMSTGGSATLADDTLLGNGFLDRQNLGNIFHTAGVFMDKFQDFNYFVAGGWSHTDANGTDEMGISLLNDFWQTPENKDGYSGYVGVRYDGLAQDYHLKLGAEYNYGSKNWLAFAPGHDDMYSSKLATRGSVYEVYGIYDLPGGEAISKFGKAFMRLGFQHYDYDYTYSAMWLGTPNKIEDIQNDPLMAQFYAPIKEMNQIYLSFEAMF